MGRAPQPRAARHFLQQMLSHPTPCPLHSLPSAPVAEVDVSYTWITSHLKHLDPVAFLSFFLPDGFLWLLSPHSTGQKSYGLNIPWGEILNGEPMESKDKSPRLPNSAGIILGCILNISQWVRVGLSPSLPMEAICGFFLSPFHFPTPSGAFLGLPS